MRRHKPQLDILDDQDSLFFSYTNNILACATLVSILTIILETVSSLSVYHNIFKYVEYATTALFTIEYLSRLWFAKSKRNYVFSFFGMVDLLAIVPTYLGLANFTFLKATRALRILRLLRMIRLAKLAKSKNYLADQSSPYALNIEIYAFSLFISVLVLGSLLYTVEGYAEYARNIPAGMYWAFMVILGGMSTAQPETIPGTLVLIAGRFVSLILLGLMLNLMGTLTRKLLIGTEGDK